MRWERRYPQLGDRMVVDKFLWWPTSVFVGNGTYETRWLEKARLTYEYELTEFMGEYHRGRELRYVEGVK